MDHLLSNRAFHTLLAGLALWSFGSVTLKAQAPMEKLAEPAVVEIGFELGTERPLLIEDGKSKPAENLPGILKSVAQTGGHVQGGVPDGWTVPENEKFGMGRIDLHLDRSQIQGDLALVVAMEFNDTTDLAVQLYDGNGEVLAMDLFGNAAANAKAAGTDTFVVPLTRYPDAASISFRRLEGALVIRRIALIPVLPELDADPEYEKELAAKLGEVLSPLHKIFQQTAPASSANAGNAVAPEPDFVKGLHMVTPMEMVNRIGSAALAEAGYPGYHSLGLGPLPDLHVYCSGTMWTFVDKAARSLALQAGREPFSVRNCSSIQVESRLQAEPGMFGLSSVAMSSADKEKFFKSRGFPVIEIPIARDAMEVLVNAGNPLREVTVPQLDAIFGKELRAGAATQITSWGQLGAAGGEIKLWGGGEGWGTTRSFQKLVLQGGPFRDGIGIEDVVWNQGVEKKVAEDPAAMGYVSLRPRGPAVRPLAIAENSGMTAYTADAQSVYSGKYPLQRKMYAYVPEKNLGEASATTRELLNLLLSSEGQAMIARTGTLPLTANEVASLRRELGLP